MGCLEARCVAREGQNQNAGDVSHSTGRHWSRDSGTVGPLLIREPYQMAPLCLFGMNNVDDFTSCGFAAWRIHREMNRRHPQSVLYRRSVFCPSEIHCLGGETSLSGIGVNSGESVSIDKQR